MRNAIQYSSENVSFQSPEVLSNRTDHVLSWKWNSGINGLTNDDDDTVDISVEIQTGATQLKPTTHVTFSGCGFLTFDPLEPKSQPRGLPREIVLRVLCDSHAKDTGLYEKSAQRRRKHCALAVVRRSRKKFAPPQTPFPGARDGQNLISWRWSLPLPTNTIWWRSIHATSSYRGNRPTHTHTPHPQTDMTDYNTLRRS